MDGWMDGLNRVWINNYQFRGFAYIYAEMEFHSIDDANANADVYANPN